MRFILWKHRLFIWVRTAFFIELSAREFSNENLSIERLFLIVSSLKKSIRRKIDSEYLEKNSVPERQRERGKTVSDAIFFDREKLSDKDFFFETF